MYAPNKVGKCNGHMPNGRLSLWSKLKELTCKVLALLHSQLDLQLICYAHCTHSCHLLTKINVYVII